MAELVAAKAEAADWQSAEYDSLLLVLRRLWRQLGTAEPDFLHADRDSNAERWKHVVQLLREHPNSTSFSRQREAAGKQLQQQPAVPPAAPAQLPSSPATSVFALLIRKMCEREGMQTEEVGGLHWLGD